MGDCINVGKQPWVAYGYLEKAGHCKSNVRCISFPILLPEQCGHICFWYFC